MVQKPAVGSEAILQGSGKGVFGGEAVIHGQGTALARLCDVRNHPALNICPTQGKTAPMKIEDDWLR